MKLNTITYRSSISANALYLEAEAYEGSDRLAKNTPGGPEIIGSVYIHPSAHVDPSAKVCDRSYIGECWANAWVVDLDWT